MSRLYANWFHIAVLGSLLTHALAYGWLLSSSAEQGSRARSVAVSILAVESGLVDEPNVQSEKRIVSDLEEPAPQAIASHGPQAHNADSPSEEKKTIATAAASNFSAAANNPTRPSTPSDISAAPRVNVLSESVFAPNASDAASQKVVVATHADLSRSRDVLLDATAHTDAAHDNEVDQLSPNDTADAPPTFALGSHRNPKPKYPYMAKKRGWQGDVLLGVEVKKNGFPQRVSVIESSGFGLLDKMAVATIRDQWQFYPAQRFRQAVVGYTEVPISFRLN